MRADKAGPHFLCANLSQAQSKQDVLEGHCPEPSLFPAHFGLRTSMPCTTA